MRAEGGQYELGGDENFGKSQASRKGLKGIQMTVKRATSLEAGEAVTASGYQVSFNDLGAKRGNWTFVRWNRERFGKTTTGNGKEARFLIPTEPAGKAE